jgi:hypothetical protein
MGDEQQKKFDLKGWAAIIAALAAMLTSVGSWYKPQDTSVEKTAYETLSTSISKLSDSEQKNHEDISNLRGYLDGISRAPLLVPADTATSSPAPTPLPADAPHPAPHAAATSPSTSGPISFALSAPPVPAVHAAPAPVAPPAFSAVAAAAAAPAAGNVP